MTIAEMPNQTENAGQWMRSSLGIGVLALAACVAGGWADPAPFLRAYLPAWLFFFGLALGSMAVLDDLSPHGRGLGLLGPPHPRGGNENAAAGDADVPADRAGNPLPLSVRPAGGGGGGRAASAPDVLSHAPFVLAPRGGLFPCLERHGLLPRRMVAAAGRAGRPCGHPLAGRMEVRADSAPSEQ